VTTRESTLASGIGYVGRIAEADSERCRFLPGLIVAGVAAGVFSTIQEMGGVIAGAAVGAIVQKEGSVVECARREELARERAIVVNSYIQHLARPPC